MSKIPVAALLVALAIVGAVAFFWHAFSTLPEQDDPQMMRTLSPQVGNRRETPLPASVVVTAPAEKWCDPVIFVPGFRVDWNGLDFETQVRVVGNPNWISIPEWDALKQKGALLQAARHRGVGKDAIVIHTYSRL